MRIPEHEIESPIREAKAWAQGWWSGLALGLFIGVCVTIIVVLSGCSTVVNEQQGTLPNGSEYSIILKEKKQ